MVSSAAGTKPLVTLAYADGDARGGTSDGKRVAVTDAGCMDADADRVATPIGQVELSRAKLSTRLEQSLRASSSWRAPER